MRGVLSGVSNSLPPVCLGWRSDSDPCTSLPKAVQSYQNSRQADNYHLSHHQSGIVTSMLRQPNVHLWTSWRSCEKHNRLAISVVNCSQIFCTFAVETTYTFGAKHKVALWIALKFFVLLQSKQLLINMVLQGKSCELLSNFLYFCSRNNCLALLALTAGVVNCSQIFCTFAVETTCSLVWCGQSMLWIALKFFVLLQSKQLWNCSVIWGWVVNCSQIFCTFAVETTSTDGALTSFKLWIALKFFVLLQSKQLRSSRQE